MASELKKNLVNAFKPFFKEHGFKKKGATWHRDTGEFIQVVNIQGSQWSPSFYINLGVYIKRFGGKETPDEAECHARERLNQIVENKNRFNDLLNYEIRIDTDVRVNELRFSLKNEGLNWLKRLSNLNEIKNVFEGSNTLTPFLKKELAEFLNKNVGG